MVMRDALTAPCSPSPSPARGEREKALEDYTDDAPAHIALWHARLGERAFVCATGTVVPKPFSPSTACRGWALGLVAVRFAQDPVTRPEPDPVRKAGPYPLGISRTFGPLAAPQAERRFGFHQGGHGLGLPSCALQEHEALVPPRRSFVELAVDDFEGVALLQARWKAQDAGELVAAGDHQVSRTRPPQLPLQVGH